jgi:RNA polymerase sigma-70 factor, ECF subfamily
MPRIESFENDRFSAKKTPDGTLASEAANELLAGAKAGDRDSLGELLTRYRSYLMLLATSQIEKRLQPRVSPSDIVQETMLKAHRHFAQFEGSSEQELLAWLRQILIHSLARFVEQYMLAAKRDIRREVSIDQSAVGGDGGLPARKSDLPADGQSPSGVAQQREETRLLAQRLAELPESYREVLVLRNIQGLSFEETSARLGRSVGATRMLWLRALEKLRTGYKDFGDGDA